MFIIEIKNESDPRLKLLDFGRSLANGKVTEQQFYQFIITRYCFPHPAYEDNWKLWSSARKKLHPFIYILQILTHLYSIDPNLAYLSTYEVADYFHKDPSHDKVRELSKLLLKSREEGAPPTQKRSDDVHRKIDDIFGFLCISGYSYFRSDGNIGLNLRRRHKSELTFYDVNRKGENSLNEVKQLINNM